jgi:hypothetical protein
MLVVTHCPGSLQSVRRIGRAVLHVAAVTGGPPHAAQACYGGCISVHRRFPTRTWSHLTPQPVLLVCQDGSPGRRPSEEFTSRLAQLLGPFPGVREQHTVRTAGASLKVTSLSLSALRLPGAPHQTETPSSSACKFNSTMRHSTVLSLTGAGQREHRPIGGRDHPGHPGHSAARCGQLMSIQFAINNFHVL